MKPYYSHAGITIYHGDCREIDAADLECDLLLSDPPYGINLNKTGLRVRNRIGGAGNTESAKRRGDPRIFGDDRPFDPSFMLQFGSEQIIWGADHFYSSLPSGGRLLAWDKVDGLEPWDDFCDVEFAYFNRGGAARIFSFRWKGLACVKAGEMNGLRDHPAQKPVALMRWCLGLSKTRGPVLDPYMGSGTTLLAAKQMNRPGIGVDVEERYCALAAKRLEQEVFDFA